jgi:hypothetical protein
MVEASRNPQHRGKSPRTGTGTQSESESVSTACLEAQRKFRIQRIVREHCPVPNSVWTEPLAGRPTVAGCALPGTAKIKYGLAFVAACLLLCLYFFSKLEILSFRAKRGISPFSCPDEREIPRFARNDKREIPPQTN